jgi:glucokinase
MEKDPMFLAGDIGATKTNLALFEVRNQNLVQRDSRSFPSSEFSGLIDLVETFLGEKAPHLEGAGFGVAGPVINGTVKTTNLPWEVSSISVGKQLGTPPAVLLNDLEAMAWGIEVLREDEFFTLQEGEPSPEGGSALIAAGTGLGQAYLVREKGRLVPRATEGGHTDFASNDPAADGFLVWLRKRLDHVSAERVVSGLGLANLYDFFHESTRSSVEPHHVDGADRARLVAESAAGKSCASCGKAFDLFLRSYGAEAGNLALKTAATSGLFIGGGIAVNNLEAMKDGRFMEAFRAKGRFSGYMGRIPVKVLLNQSAPLLGAAMAVARSLGKI